MSSDPMGALALLAQVAISLAGFSSILVAFRRAGERGDWLPEDAFRFRAMLQASLTAGLFAALPHVLAGAFPSVEMPWRALALAVGLSQGASLGIALRVGRRTIKPSSLNPIVFVAGMGGNAASIVLTLCGAAGWVDAASVYLLTVGWMTAFAGLMFYRLVTAPLAARES